MFVQRVKNENHLNFSPLRSRAQAVGNVSVSKVEGVGDDLAKMGDVKGASEWKDDAPEIDVPKGVLTSADGEADENAPVEVIANRDLDTLDAADEPVEEICKQDRVPIDDLEIPEVGMSRALL